MEMLSLPLAMSAAAALAGGRLRERRRRACLNRALHELRRPLQSLLLASVDSARIEPVLASLADLDRAINGGPAPIGREAVEVRALVEEAIGRWSGSAAGPATRPALRWSAGQVVVVGDRLQLARALDNLLANAIEHGRGPVDVVACLRAGRLRILVRDGGARRAGPRRRDPRRGHGLTIVGEIAAAHGGRFVLRRSPSLTIAALDLPFAEPVPDTAA